MGVNFIKNIKFWLLQKNCKFFSYIKFGIENGEELGWKFWVENFVQNGQE